MRALWLLWPLARAFEPDTLPEHVRTFSDIGPAGQAAPYAELQLLLAQTCGLPFAELATELATLPQVISNGLRSVFMLWSIYILGNFLAVGVMSLFHLAPTGRRCWGFFQENSYDYKRFVGPLYYVLFILSLLVALAMTWRFLTEVHGYRQFLHRLEHQGGQGCLFIMGMRWMGYRHCFDLLLLMVFTSLDLIFCIAEIGWMCVLQFMAYCRCFFCSFWKGCCGICGWCCCNLVASLCCLLPLAGVVMYLFMGLLAAALCGMLTLVLLGAVLLGLSWALRLLLQRLLGCCCQALPPASFYDMALLLYPFPPGSPYFTTAMAVRRPLNEEEAEQDAARRKEGRQSGSEEQLTNAIWEDHMGVPQRWVTYAFPAWWSLVLAPGLLLTVAVCAVLNGNGLLLSEAMAHRDLSWMPTNPMNTWSYHWCVIRAVCGGITDAFHGLFIEAPFRFISEPFQATKRFWTIADNGSDFLNLFASDPSHAHLVDGQFSGNFHVFRATVLLRLLLTMLFTCLRLTATIARTPEEDEMSWYDDEDFEDIVCGI